MKLKQAIEVSLVSGLYNRETLVRESLSAFSVSKLAEILSGSTDKKSKEYQAKRRLASYYKEGKRSPSKENQEKLREAALENRRSTISSIKVKVTGTLKVSRDRRKRVIELNINPSTYRDLSEQESMEQLLSDYGVDNAYFEDYQVTI